MVIALIVLLAEHEGGWISENAGVILQSSQPFRRWPKMRKAFVLSFALFSGTLLLPAQQTWNGLRFGMTEAEVKIALKGTMIPAGPKDQPDEPMDFYYGGRVENLTLEGLPGGAGLAFNKKSKKLVFVLVTFIPKKLQEQSPTVGRIRDDFVKKYGSPALSRGFGPEGCDERISDSCHLIFHNAGQSIDVHFLTADEDLIGVEVQYEPFGASPAI